MTLFTDRLKGSLSVLLPIALGISAFIFFSLDHGRPLVDYDEATYANVVVDTLNSGDFWTFQLHGQPWIDNKPPLVLWLTMASVAVFGPNEFAFRIISILASVLCCWLVYLIVKQLTKDWIAATIGYFFLLFAFPFFVYAREFRHDSAVTAGVMAALYFYLKARDDKRYLIGIFPAIALGFLAKSVIALLAVPILIAHSLLYSNWSYVKSKYFWAGLPFAMAIVIPWYFVNVTRFGWSFLVQSFYDKVITLAVHGVPRSSPSYLDYFGIFINGYLLWTLVLVAMVLVILYAYFIAKSLDKSAMKDIFFPIGAALFIFAVFTVQRYHLSVYVMIAYPLFAVAIGTGYHHIARAWKKLLVPLSVLMSVLLTFGFIACITRTSIAVQPYVYDERTIGVLYRSDPMKAPLYQYNWIPSESFNFYGDARSTPLNPNEFNGKTIQGPFYLIMPSIGVTYFFYAIDKPINPCLKLLFLGKYFALIYCDRTMQMPNLRYY